MRPDIARKIMAIALGITPLDRELVPMSIVHQACLLSEDNHPFYWWRWTTWLAGAITMERIARARSDLCAGPVAE